MSIKWVAAVGWICFALDVAFVVALIVIKDSGSDAAGRGVGRGWGIILLPLLLAAGGLLWWATNSASKPAIIAGTFLVAIPFLVMGNSKLKQMRENAQSLANKAKPGQFADSTLRTAAAFIDAGDTTALRALLVAHKSAGTPVNYTERDKAGCTLLGFAAFRATDYETSPDKLASLRILFENGVPYSDDAMEENGNWVRDLVMRGKPNADEAIDMALTAGANPNAQARYDKFNMILDDRVSVSTARILVKHGADVHALSDEGHTTLMRAIRFKKFPEALFYLQQGVDPNYVAPDGSTVRSELDRVVQQSKNYQQPMEEGYAEFVAALNSLPAKKL